MIRRPGRGPAYAAVMAGGGARERIRVLHVITDRDRRGAQVFAGDLAAGLSKLGVDNTVVALAPGEHGDLLPVQCLGPGRRSVRTLMELRRRARSCDVVVAHGSATLLACSVALVGMSVPFVYRQISDPVHWAGTWSRRLRVAMFLRRATEIVALSTSAAQVLRKHYWLRAGSIRVIPNAVPSVPFGPATPAQRNAGRERFRLPLDVPVALCMCALAPEKGVDLVINAMGGLAPSHLLIVGDGPERTRLESLARQVAPGRVVFTGSIEEAPPALHAADLIVLSSRGGDSMPAALIEAGLCAVPAVSTPVGAITEVVIHEVTGLIVAIDDQVGLTHSMKRLLDDTDERGTFGFAARDRCGSMFTIEATAPEWLEVLRRTERHRGRGWPFAARQHRG